MKFAFVLSTLFYVTNGQCPVGQALCILEGACTVGTCIPCVDGAGSQYGSCASYGKGQNNNQWCSDDTAITGESVLDNCPQACGKCSDSNTAPAPAPADADWDGVCPDGHQLFRVSGANQEFGTEIGECVEMCTPIKVYTDRLLSLMRGVSLNERCASDSSPYSNYWWPVSMTTFEFQCTMATCGSELTLSEEISNVYKWGREQAPVTVAPDTEVVDGFDFGSGCAAGEGAFERELPKAGEAFDIGFIPAGKFDVFIKLSGVGVGAGDIDIQIFDYDYKGEEGKTFPEGRAVIAWCNSPSTCNFGDVDLVVPSAAEAEYNRNGEIDTMTFEYSGYSPDPTKPNNGDEFIRIKGMSTTRLLMRAWAYTAGAAAVEYTWGADQSECCLGTAQCSGEFTRVMKKDTYADIGEIPVGVLDLQVNLDTDSPTSDLDIQLYDQSDTSRFEEGAAIVGWCDKPSTCNFGVINDFGPGEATYEGLDYSYSGYNGQDGQLGKEFIKIDGATNVPLMMKAFAYSDGEATVTYTYWQNPQ